MGLKKRKLEERNRRVLQQNGAETWGVSDRENGVKRSLFFIFPFKMEEVRAYLYAEGSDLVVGGD